MSRINTARYSEALRRRLNLDGDQGPSELGPEIHAVLDMEPGPADWQFLGAVRRMAGFATQAGVAAEFQGIVFSNPSGSGVIAVVDRILASSGSATTFQIGWSTATATGQGQALDSRWFQGGSPVGRSSCRISGRSAAGSGLTTGAFTAQALAATLLQLMDVGWVLLPGYAIIVENLTVNNPINASFQWRERALQDFEIAGT